MNLVNNAYIGLIGIDSIKRHCKNIKHKTACKKIYIFFNNIFMQNNYNHIFIILRKLVKKKHHMHNTLASHAQYTCVICTIYLRHMHNTLASYAQYTCVICTIYLRHMHNILASHAQYTCITVFKTIVNSTITTVKVQETNIIYIYILHRSATI